MAIRPYIIVWILFGMTIKAIVLLTLKSDRFFDGKILLHKDNLALTVGSFTSI
jgi:hypothetical protein